MGLEIKFLPAKILGLCYLKSIYNLLEKYKNKTFVQAACNIVARDWMW